MKARKAPAHLQRFADRLAIDLEPIVEAKLERVYDAALSAASSELAVEKPRAQPAKTPAPKAKRTAKPKTTRAPREDAAPTTKGTPRKRAVMRCRKCGAEGYRSDGCGTSHTPQTTPAETVTRAPSGKPSKLTGTAREILARTRAARGAE